MKNAGTLYISQYIFIRNIDPKRHHIIQTSERGSTSELRPRDLFNRFSYAIMGGWGLPQDDASSHTE